ncbi:uncharacterized protein LOC143672789 isoform X2 [Tamandua tetradactyla]|uniref:uncharacterized protein LOC143672789 isoform X2 n=1 Tax=Tamandua tetradactyla TaxID=48850 RepID=UPI0040545F65
MLLSFHDVLGPRQAVYPPAKSVVDQEETGSLDSKGGRHESHATGGDPPVPVEGSTCMGPFNSDTLEKSLLPRTPNPVATGHQLLSSGKPSRGPQVPELGIKCWCQQA